MRNSTIGTHQPQPFTKKINRVPMPLSLRGCVWLGMILFCAAVWIGAVL